MNDKGRGRLLSSAGIGVAALVPAAGLALLAAQVSSTGYVLPAAVNTLAGPTSQTPSLPTSSPPEPATVDDEPIEVLTAPRSAVAAVHRADAAYARTAAGATGGDIPAVAIAAYMRAATVINAADKGCHLDWEILAAIGRVESNHGRFAGSSLDDQGVATPPILGLRLDGTHGTTRIADTDAGEYDGDKRFDRAVGPMQFIPSTWSYVGVDADGDGKRDPQDIQDASLGAAVYLCVGKGDLSTQEGQRAAVYRYNHSQRYVDLVLSIARGYASGSMWSTPGGSAPTTTISSVTDPGTPVDPSPPPHAEPVLVELTQVVVLEQRPPLPEVPSTPPPPGPDTGPGPTDPPPPTDPSDPAEPGEPTDPSEPAEPTEPAEPAEPTPAEPTEPAATQPSDLPTATPDDRAAVLCEDAELADAVDAETCRAEAVELIDQQPGADVSAADLLARLEELGILGDPGD